jgi:hypothetical protein
MGPLFGTKKQTWDEAAEAGDPWAQFSKDLPIRFHFTNCMNEHQSYTMVEFQNRDGKWDDLVAAVLRHTRPDDKPLDWKQHFGDMAAQLIRLLVVSLGTRNVERVTKRNSLARFGLGKKPGADYDYVTTIRMGKLVVYDDDEPNHVGDTRRPHLRRGHVRNQHYGPKNQYIKRVWIAPVFVNGYVPGDDHRTAYNVVKS